MQDAPLESLAREFKRFAKEECYKSCPLYVRLSLGIGGDPEILALAAYSRKGEKVPNLFLATVHFLLLKGTQHPLSVIYKGSARTSNWAEDPYPKFRSFCLEHIKEIRALIAARSVQTNEVGRSALLLPAFVLVSRQAQGRPLHLLEIGASAGLNLLWDRYGYDYGDGQRCGDLSSPVQITCSLRADLPLPVPTTLPEVGIRFGVDLNPIDVRDPEATLWLRALVWPGDKKRDELLQHAIEVAQQDPPTLLAGDGVELLPEMLERVPKDGALCIIRTFTKLSPKAREQLSSLIAHHGGKRDLYLVATTGKGGLGDQSALELVSYTNGVRTEKLLAYCENHGEWLEWLVE